MGLKGCFKGVNDQQPHTMTAQVEDIRRVCSDIAILRLRVEGVPGFGWHAGQYVMIGLDGIEHRPYSIANAPSPDGVLEIHIKDAKNGGMSSQLLAQAHKGLRLNLEGPRGTAFLLPEDVRSPILLIAGGMGITPLKAIAEQAVTKASGAPVTLYWGTERPEDQYLKDEFEAQAADQPGFDFISVAGTPVVNAVVQTYGALASSRIYLAGPPAMLDTAVPLLIRHGARADHIYFDAPSLSLSAGSTAKMTKRKGPDQP